MTIGWIVVLQVGLLLIDRFHFGVQLAPGKWLAVVVILVAQGYLLLGPTSAADSAGATVSSITVTSRDIA